MVLCRLTHPPRSCLVPLCQAPGSGRNPTACPGTRRSPLLDQHVVLHRVDAALRADERAEPGDAGLAQAAGLEHVPGRGVAQRGVPLDPDQAEGLEAVPQRQGGRTRDDARARAPRGAPRSRSRPRSPGSMSKRLTTPSSTSSSPVTAQVTDVPDAGLLGGRLEPRGCVGTEVYGDGIRPSHRWVRSSAAASTTRSESPARSGRSRTTESVSAGVSSQAVRGDRSSVDSRVPDQASTSSSPRCRR